MRFTAGRSDEGAKRLKSAGLPQIAPPLWGISDGRFHRGIIPLQLEGIKEMSPRVEPSNPFQDALAALLNQGLEGAGEALRILVNEASEIENPPSENL